MASLTVIFENKLFKKRVQSTALHICLETCIALCLCTILLINTEVDAQNNPVVIVINASESDIYNSWNTTGLDGICANSTGPGVPNVSAARPFTSQLQGLMPTNEDNDETRRYIGARLYPELTQGWYWPGPNWSQENAALFYSTYNEGGQTVNYSNWTENGLPPAGEVYGTRQVVIWNATENGWVTVDLRTEGQAQIACWLNAVYPTPYAGNETNETGNETNETGNETNETGNETNETGNETNETGNETNETGNVTNETGNETNETGNETNETGNETNETGNETNETGNETNETGNETNETGNETNETGNKTNETGNETNETGNETNETNNMGDFLVPGSIAIIIVVDEAEVQNVFFQEGTNPNAIQRMLLADEADVNAMFYTEGLDGLCQRNLPNGINASAVRLYTANDEQTFQQNLGGLNPAQRLYLGARLYQRLSQGWYWAGPNWSPNGAQLFYTTYNEGGQTVMYSNWAPIGGLPPAGELYGTRQAVSYNLTVNAWQAVTLRTEGQAQVACMSMGPRPSGAGAPWRYVHHGMAYYGYIIIFVPIAVIIIVGTVIAFAALFACMPADYLTGNTQPYY